MNTPSHMILATALFAAEILSNHLCRTCRRPMAGSAASADGCECAVAQRPSAGGRIWPTLLLGELAGDLRASSFFGYLVRDGRFGRLAQTHTCNCLCGVPAASCSHRLLPSQRRCAAAALAGFRLRISEPRKLLGPFALWRDRRSARSRVRWTCYHLNCLAAAVVEPTTGRFRYLLRSDPFDRRISRTPWSWSVWRELRPALFGSSNS